jgi:two-component system response regulator YesN
MYSVLIADDEKIIRKGLCSIIDWEALGFTIAGEAQNGREVLSFLEVHNPDVVLIDIRMPLLHGLDAIRQARESGYKGKFIILSGYSDFTYAQDAIKYGVSSYLTKPVDEKELTSILTRLHQELDAQSEQDSSHQFYYDKAKNMILQDFLCGITDLESLNPEDLTLTAEQFQVILYEKYSYNIADASYDFAELLRVSNQNQNAYEFLTIHNQHVILLKGSHAIEKFNDILAKYDAELPPQKNSPLDTIFISRGRIVSGVENIPCSYTDAATLLTKRFFCEQHQHIISYDNQPQSNPERTSDISSGQELLSSYEKALVDHIQAYNRNKIAETLHSLEQDLYTVSLTIIEEKNLLVDLYLHIKEKISFLYHSSEIPFIANSVAINTILHSYYLYEIIAFLSEQFEMIMNSIGYSSRDSIIDDIVYYIEHNYSENITLENIAPLFGYNSSYLGKIFNKKLGINFNTYLDNIRIEHSKELLVKSKLQVYKIAELVGYRNVDYFHIKFKKGTGLSPAEYRKQNTKEDTDTP